MKKFVAVMAVGLALAGPGVAAAREVTLTTQLSRYSGENAYIVYYITDASGAFKQTLWMAGGRSKYYRHLSDWKKISGQSSVDGITGASVGSGQSLKIKVDIADALIDAGYVIRLDTAVEDQAERPSEVVAPLDSKSAGTPISGGGYVDTFTFDM
ncbi:MAG: DUF2271 domain-containing protein [Allorhizobium sp.]